MIKLFDCNDTEFNTSNGDRIIKATKCKVTKGDITNSEYYVDLETSIDYADILVQDKIIVVPTPDGEQPFRLNNPQKKSDKLVFKAYHIFYDSKGYVVEDAYPQNKTCRGALEWVVGKTDTPNSFNVYSNITDVRTERYVNMSLFAAVCEMTNTWGGVLDVDGMQIKIVSSIGEDRGITISYGKNLKTITAKEDWTDVCTTLYAIGYDGIQLDKPLVSDITYGRPYSKVVQFAPDLNVDINDEAAVHEDLRKQATAYLDKNQYPKVTYTVKSHMAGVVSIGDKIEVKHEKLNIDLNTEVKSYTYNVLTRQFEEITFGNYVQNIKKIFKETAQQIEEVKATSSQRYDAIKKGLEESKNLINKYLSYGYRYETESAQYYMNADNPDDATNFMIISLGGIGFGKKQKGEAITKAQYTTAWDIEGNFNAEFITTGGLNAQIIKVNGYDKNLEEILTDIDDTAKSAKMLALITSKEFIGVSTNADGENGDYASAEFYVTCQYGSQNVTSEACYEIVAPKEITGTWLDETRTYSISNMSTDTEVVCVRATYNDMTVEREIVVCKIKAGETGATGLRGEKGDTGATGAAGAAARTFYITSSTDVLNRKISNSLSPTTVAFNAYYRDGVGASNAYAGRFIIQESTDGSTWTTKYTSSANESSKVYTPSTSTKITHIRCILYLAEGTSQILDIKTVSIIFDSDTIRGLLAIENNTTVIDGGFILTNSIKAKSLDVVDLFAQKIEATGSISGATLISYDELQKVVVEKGSIKFYSVNTRGEGEWLETGSVYPASMGDIAATGNWIFDNVQTKSGADLDEINSNLTALKSESNDLRHLGTFTATTTAQTFTINNFSGYKTLVFIPYDGTLNLDSIFIPVSAFKSGLQVSLNAYALANYHGVVSVSRVSDTSIRCQIREITGWSSINFRVYGMI